jgi:hypothetical protein
VVALAVNIPIRSARLRLAVDMLQGIDLSHDLAIDALNETSLG